MTRDEAVDAGRLRGELEADSRAEAGEMKDERVRRAMCYAAWQWDGRPASSAAQRKEFRVTDAPLTDSLDRSIFSRLLKQDK